jgi:hypothetical protein
MSAPFSPCRTRTVEMSTLAVCKSLIAASTACVFGREGCKLVDRSMAEVIYIGRRTLGHIFSSSGRYFQDTLGRRKSHQCPDSTG